MHFRIPVISIVGRGGSDRTTLLEGLISLLAARGWRVATAKHHVHETDIDVPGKDTWRHERAGALVTMVSGPNRLGVFRRVDRERTLAELVDTAGDVDILLTEGFRNSSPVLVEVVRAERSTEPLCDLKDLFAVCTDVPALASEHSRSFGPNDAAGLARVVEEEFLPGRAADLGKEGS